MSSKACTKCAAVKPVADFHRSSRAKDGRKAWCKSCALAAAEKRRREHRDKVNAAIEEFLARG